jgi:hypothetical protein
LAKQVGTQLAFVADQVSGTLIPEQDGLTPISPNDKTYSPLLTQGTQGSLIKQVWRNAAGVLHLEISIIDLLKSPDFTLAV